MNTSTIEKVCANISNSWIIGCSIFSYGIITYAYLHSIDNLSFIHRKRKHWLKLQQNANPIEYNEKINMENQQITFYCIHYNAVYILALSGLSFVAYKSIGKK